MNAAVETPKVNKMAIAKELFDQVYARGANLNGKGPRGRFIELAMEKGLSKHCAGTYFQNLSNESRGLKRYKYNKVTKKAVAAAEAQVLTDIGKFRWMVLKDGVEVNSFETRTAAQNASKEVEGSKWADRTKAA